MSDFDKEAEREKLRKKFEAEEERRETTQQMSELLLKGATMLNVHCADCAAPVFRHNGKEFCPTCQRPIEELTTAGPGDLSGPGGLETGAESASATEEPPAQATDDAADSGPAEIEVENPDEPDATAEQATDVESEPEPEPEPEPAPSRQPANGQRARTTASEDQAVESLAGAITRLSERAASADDPRQAQELLAAANEAAEVLRRLRE